MFLLKNITRLAFGLGCILNQSALSVEDDLRGSRPNIVFFLADDQSFPDHAINGNTKVPAPTTLAFSKQALVFDRAYTGQAVCAPSRSMLYSGLYPIRNGCFLNHYSVRSGVKTIAAYLRELDYQVILAGKSHVNPSSQFPWSEHMNPVREPGLPRPVIPLAEMDRFIANSGDQPFCMIVASEYPHGPYIKDTPFTESDIQMPSYLPSTEGNLRRATQYYASIAQKEKEFQAVLNLLKQHNRESDTLVLYADDHGADMGKFTVSDRGLRVAFMARWPGKIATGRTAALTSFADFVPTAIELAGGTVPENLDGKSLLPVLSGSTSEHHDYVYGVSHNQGILRRSVFPQRSVHDGRYHYVRNFNNMERIERERAAGKAINYFLERGAKEHGLPEEQLFDTQADPFEFKNLAEDPQLAEIKARLKAALFAWMEQQNDHLSEDGPITLFAVKKHPLNQTEKQFNYVVPEEHSGPVAGLVDPHASTQPKP
jgi:uncharacterized sulfatase